MKRNRCIERLKAITGSLANRLPRYPYYRIIRRYWRLGESNKMEMYQFDSPKAVDFSYYSANAENAQEGGPKCLDPQARRKDAPPGPGCLSL